MTSYSLAPLAYLKLMLHSAKYPANRTVGLLIGRSLPAESPSLKTIVEIEDTIPLVHNWTDLSPMTEATLHLADIYVGKERKGSRIVGVYVANEGVEDTAVPRTVGLIADQLREEFEETVILVVDSRRLNTVDPALLPYLSTTTSPTTWTSSPFTPLVSLIDERIVTKTNLAIKEGKYNEIADFTDHLDDVKLDWLGNPRVTLE